LAATTGETASLAVPQGLALVYVDQVESPNVLSADWLGRRVALHATSTGKAYLAWLPPEEVAAALPARLERYTSTTLVDERAFRDELARTRERGYGICEGELETTLWGVSAPVFNAVRRPVAVVSVWGTSTRVRRERFGALGAVVIADTRRLTDCFPSVDYFEQRGTPFVVAVNCFDGDNPHSVDDVRIALDLDDDVPVLLCDVRRRTSAKEVMIALVEHSLRTLASAN
jgi:hypothetical protein